MGINLVGDGIKKAAFVGLVAGQGASPGLEGFEEGVEGLEGGFGGLVGRADEVPAVLGLIRGIGWGGRQRQSVEALPSRTMH